MEITDIDSEGAKLIAKNDTKSLFVKQRKATKLNLADGFHTTYGNAKPASVLSSDRNVFFTSKSKIRVQPVGEYRDTMFIAAPSGNGKSTHAASYAREYLAKHPKRRCYIFKPDDRPDPAFEGLPRTKFYSAKEIPDLLEELGPDALDIDQFIKSLVIIDDIAAIQDPLAKITIERLKDAILENGRKLNISCVITSHQLATGIPTRKMLYECNLITFFPRISGMDDNIRYYLKKHLGFGKKEIEFVMNLPILYGARAVTLLLDPRMAIWDHGMALL